MPILLEPAHSYGALPAQWSSLVGIVTAIIGNILISFALNTQRYAHIRIDREFKDQQDPDAKSVQGRLTPKLRNYGAVVQQEEAAEERQRINERAEVLSELVGRDQEDGKPTMNGKHQASDDDSQDGHNDTKEEESRPHRKSYLQSPYWWLGISLMTVGETGNFLAYGFAPASIVSPLGVVGLISNCLIAPLMLKERFRQRDFWGVLIAIGGAVTVVLSAKTSEKKLGPDGLWTDIKRWEFLVYVVITIAFIIALMVLSPKYGHHTIMIDLGLVGLFGGYTALSTKGVASLLSASLYMAFEYPIFYVLILILVGSAVMQIRYLNRGLQNFDSTQVIPVQFVMFTLSTIIGSAVLYRDFERTDLEHVLKFILGCLLTFGGVYLITSGRKNDEEEEDPEGIDHDVERIHLLDDEAGDQSPSPIKQEPDQKIDPELESPQTPHPDLSRTSSAVPSIAVTPAASADDFSKNPWISSTDHLVRAKSHEVARPVTPTDQTLPSASGTPYFTPSTSQRARDRFNRTISSPAQPSTPTRRQRGPSPTKASLEAQAQMQASQAKRGSISRLLPGPILQPLSSSLSGIVADRIRRGEGTGSPISPSLRRQKSNRDSTRVRPPFQTSVTDLEAGIAASESRDIRRATVAAGEDSPLLRRSGTVSGAQQFGGQEEGDEGFVVGNLKKTKGRLRSMSETLTSFMTGQRKGGRDDGEQQRREGGIEEGG